MFHQVRVRPEDASAFRFLWRRPGSSEPPDTYQMDVQIFGAVSSPSICAHSLQQAAKDCGPDSAAVLQQVVDHFYVDNWLTSFRTVQEAKDAAATVYQALMDRGFELAKWGSSSKAVLMSLPGVTTSTRNMDLEDLPVERTLGLILDFNQD